MMYHGYTGESVVVQIGVSKLSTELLWAKKQHGPGQEPPSGVWMAFQFRRHYSAKLARLLEEDIDSREYNSNTH
jgi:hypothetical protein